jgi:hypothetical protein
LFSIYQLLFLFILYAVNLFVNLFTNEIAWNIAILSAFYMLQFRSGFDQVLLTDLSFYEIMFLTIVHIFTIMFFGI